MPRILGVDIPKDKHIEIALTYIYGIGRPSAQRILQRCGIPLSKKARDLEDTEVSSITEIIQREYKVEGELKRYISTNIKRLMDIGVYRGLRHRRGLPVRGQKTRKNARTRRGPRKGIGGIKNR